MFRLALIIAVIAHTGLAKPTNCMLFCDEQQQQQQQQPSGYVNPSRGPYNVNGVFGRPSYGVPSGKLENFDVGYVQPGNYPSMNYPGMNYPAGRVVSMPQTQPGQLDIRPSQGLEALFHHSTSSSSSSSSNSLGYFRQYPNVINTGPVVQNEPLIRPAKICANEYVNPCY